jgi:hypothetical protein
LDQSNGKGFSNMNFKQKSLLLVCLKQGFYLFIYLDIENLANFSKMDPKKKLAEFLTRKKKIPKISQFFLSKNIGLKLSIS